MRLAAALLSVLVLQPQAVVYPPEAPPRVDPVQAYYASRGLEADVAMDVTQRIDIQVLLADNISTSHCQPAINVINTALANSQLAASVALVGCQPVAYTHVNASADLSYVAAGGAGNAQAEMWRNANGADTTIFLTLSGDYCGLAYQQASSINAYAWVSDGCCVGNLSCPHELGHNVGLAHDPANQTNPVFTYGYGYCSPDLLWRTIMAYPTGNAQFPCGGIRLPYYSSPTYTHNGAPMGTADKYDNRRVFSERAAVVAGFRLTVPVSQTPAPAGAPQPRRTE